MIDENEIRHIASLSMLNLNDDEIEKYMKNMQDMVELANKVSIVDTDGVTESAYALDSFNVFRKDEVIESLPRDLLLENAPSSNGEAFSLPSMN